MKKLWLVLMLLVFVAILVTPTFAASVVAQADPVVPGVTTIKEIADVLQVPFVVAVLLAIVYMLWSSHIEDQKEIRRLQQGQIMFLQGLVHTPGNSGSATSPLAAGVR